MPKIFVHRPAGTFSNNAIDQLPHVNAVEGGLDTEARDKLLAFLTQAAGKHTGIPLGQRFRCSSRFATYQPTTGACLVKR